MTRGSHEAWLKKEMGFPVALAQPALSPSGAHPALLNPLPAFCLDRCHSVGVDEEDK
jgi:hypothetical protein